MRKITCIFPLLIILFCIKLFAQQPSFNHLTVYVTDLSRSGDFYDNVMKLQRIPEPFHDKRHIWYKITDHGELHVVSGSKETTTHDIIYILHLQLAQLKCFQSALMK